MENCLARIPEWKHPNLSLVSKSILSFLSSPELYNTRSRIGTTEPCLYFGLAVSDDRPKWFTLFIKPADETLTLADDDYSLVSLPSRLNLDQIRCISKVAVGSEIYILGGPLSSSAVRILDCMTHTLRDGPSMLVARKGAYVVYLDKKIYVMGGCPVDESLPWMEVLDMKTQTWRALPSHGAEEFRMKLFRVNVLEGKIFVVEKEKDYSYNPKEGKWEVVEIHSDLRIHPWCVIENVMYCFTYYGCFMWYDSKTREWMDVKLTGGSYLELTYNYRSWNNCRRDVPNYDGKLLVTWTSRSGEDKKTIWFVKIALEKRHGGEI